MSLTIDWDTRVVSSDASITDLSVFADDIHDLETSVEGLLHPVIIQEVQMDLPSGGEFYGVKFINSYTLTFPNAGNYTIVGNLTATIVPVAGVYVERISGAGDLTARDMWTGTAVEGGYTPLQILRLIAAALAGKTEVSGNSVVFRSLLDDKSRIQATMSGSNRTVMVYDLTDAGDSEGEVTILDGGEPDTIFP
jgi:hypothetical protein